MFFLFLYLYHYLFFFFFKQKTAYELRISDWSSDVCSSDLKVRSIAHPHLHAPVAIMIVAPFGPATLAIMPAPGPPVAAPIAAVVMPPVAPPVPAPVVPATVVPTPVVPTIAAIPRSDVTRIGKEFVRKWRPRWAQYHYK